MRRIIGNLDFETRLAIENPPARRTPEGAGHALAPPSISPAVLETISPFATLLRALAEEGDHLWTPHPVDPARVENVPGLPLPTLESGARDRVAPASSLLAWGETAEIANERAPGREPSTPDAGGESHPIGAWLWKYARPSPAAVARVNHRSFYLDLARRLGHALPGARLLESVAELKHHLERGGAGASPSGDWILKAPFSAAGRERLRGRGSDLATPRDERHARNLFARYGTLLFEPWLDRIEDLGCCALLDAEMCRIVSLHRQEVDSYGRMRSLELAPRSLLLPGVTDEDASAIERLVGDVGEALLSAGYRGPFGVDGWRYRGADGRPVLHAFGEINARMSFGLVGRVLFDRLEPGFEPDDRERWILRFGSPGASPGAAPRRAVTLVQPSGGTGGAWIEMLPPGGRASRHGS